MGIKEVFTQNGCLKLNITVSYLETLTKEQQIILFNTEAKQRGFARFLIRQDLFGNVYIQDLKAEINNLSILNNFTKKIKSILN